MFYRIRLTMAFPDSVNPESIRARAMTLAPQSIAINPGQLNEERSSITLEQCFHDQDPSIPCKPIFTWPGPGRPAPEEV